MSHKSERKSKNCLNCGSIVQGHFCQNCGQENLEPEESFAHLLTHFFADVTHFDGKIFTSIKFLFLRPGFLTKEYIRGRRQKYLNPLRMFLFTSFIFFLIYFSFVNKNGEASPDSYKKIAVATIVQDLKDTASATGDSLQKSALQNTIATLNKTFPTVKESSEESFVIYNQDLPLTLRQYDSIQRTLPPGRRDNFLERKINRKGLEKQQQGNLGKVLFARDVTEHFMKSIPQMLFISLPLLALFFKFMYSGRKRHWEYVNHIIFLIHVFIAVYLLMLIQLGFQGIYHASGYSVFQWLAVTTYICMFLYPFVAMYNFYEQGFFITVIKYLTLLVFASIVILCLIAFFALYTFFRT